MGATCCAARPGGETASDAPLTPQGKRLREVTKSHFKTFYIRENEKKVHKSLSRGVRLPEKTELAECQCCRESGANVELAPCTCCGAAFCISCLELSTILELGITSDVKVCCACIQMIQSYAYKQDVTPEDSARRPQTARTSKKLKRRKTKRPTGENRQTREREMLLACKAGDKDPHEQWYLISSEWLRTWRKWSTQNADSTLALAGPISNDLLMLGVAPHWTLNLKLKAEKHYRAINQRAWDALVGIYGGGPAVVADKIDIKGAWLITDEKADDYSDTSDHDSIGPDYTISDKLSIDIDENSEFYTVHTSKTEHARS